MSFTVSQEAAKWYKEEMDLQEGDYVQFYVKLYGGIPTIHPNYFLGISFGKNGNIAVKDEVEGITFFFSDKDSWFIDEYNVNVEAKDDEVEYIFNQK
ncbi:HesB/YadR/YfhF family protein [Robertmurraya sp. Marseille-Q9965]